MSNPFVPQGEPIPGYKLLEPIGRGGFGEVWKAEAPGGFLKAIKIVQGTIRSGVGDEALVLQELTSLSAIKNIRHPYVLSLDRYDIVDGRLVIVMELADCNLWDRFQQCAARGRTGIPRNELLRYMAEAAEALDLMNARYRLQHSDIKPQNLFLVHNHVKVGDFGLVKDLEGLKAVGNGCFSPLYAAPELFEGGTSLGSDQYSLAIVYQELLTGQRPFDGKNARQLLLQHVQAPPDVSSLPEADQPIIRRALAKNPGERFGSCGAFIWALRNGAGEQSDTNHGFSATPAPVLKPIAELERRPPPPPAPVTLADVRAAVEGYAVERGVCQIQCPNCGYTGRLPNRFKGLRIQCRQCQQKFMAEPSRVTPLTAQRITDPEA